MCYSNASTSTNVQLGKHYKRAVENLPEIPPLFFASGFDFPLWRIVTSSEHIVQANWGLVPHWYNGNDLTGFRTNTLNARIETIHEKASFRDAVITNRCIIPSTGFFEWQTNGKVKTPYFIHLPNNDILSMAGIHASWKDPRTGAALTSFSIITCPANPFMASIHNTKQRMPVLLQEKQLESWIQGELPLNVLHRPHQNDALIGHRINKQAITRKVNSPEIQIQENQAQGYQPSLFD
jgi:putative SOS response-associated peptidase YedK